MQVLQVDRTAFLVLLPSAYSSQIISLAALKLAELAFAQCREALRAKRVPEVGPARAPTRRGEKRATLGGCDAYDEF